MLRAMETDTPSTPSLSEVHSSVEIPRQLTFWRRFFAFSGPAYLVSVGYMDPGNWATDLEGGSQFGYPLIWVLLMSNLMAILLQTLLGAARRRHRHGPGAGLPRRCSRAGSSWALWVLAEIAIAACDLAEVLGTAIGLKLLFGMPLLLAVFVTALDTFLLLLLHRKGVRQMEAVILVPGADDRRLLRRRDLPGPIRTGGSMAAGLRAGAAGPGALFVAIGILGATVMPHNLYLHSALVQSRARPQHAARGSAPARFNLIDSVIALNGALLVNAALLVLAGGQFFKAGLRTSPRSRTPTSSSSRCWATSSPPIPFAVALLAAGPVVDAHRHPRRPDRHGGVPPPAHAAAGPPPAHPRARDRPAPW